MGFPPIISTGGPAARPALTDTFIRIAASDELFTALSVLIV
jgi:hypothetical protein